MRYQLILQFKGDSLGDYDSMIELENSLMDALSGVAEIDGHDVGSGEINIFTRTRDPEVAFDRAKPTLESVGLLDLVHAAYRPAAGGTYTILWPPHVGQFAVA